jgi:hypothetical protein
MLPRRTLKLCEENKYSTVVIKAFKSRHVMSGPLGPFERNLLDFSDSAHGAGRMLLLNEYPGARYRVGTMLCLPMPNKNDLQTSSSIGEFFNITSDLHTILKSTIPWKIQEMIVCFQFLLHNLSLRICSGRDRVSVYEIDSAFRSQESLPKVHRSRSHRSL